MQLNAAADRRDHRNGIHPPQRSMTWATVWAPGVTQETSSHWRGQAGRGAGGEGQREVAHEMLSHLGAAAGGWGKSGRAWQWGGWLRGMGAAAALHAASPPAADPRPPSRLHPPGVLELPPPPLHPQLKQPACEPPLASPGPGRGCCPSRAVGQPTMPPTPNPPHAARPPPAV